MSKPGCKPYKWKTVGNREGATTTGYMMEHRIIAEQIVGRPLKPEEVVHHKDGNTLNNDVSNLMVFANSSHHNYFHGGREAYEDNGVWKCKDTSTCMNCGKEFIMKFKEQRFCSKECSNNSFRHFEASDDEIMARLFENNGNFTKTAKEFNVCANALVKRLKLSGHPYHSKDYK